MQEDKIAGFLFEPAGGSKGPAVLCVGGSEGGASMVDQAALLASHGHTALALAYFAWPGRPDELRKIPLEYFADAARRLRRDSAGRRVAIMGASRGGEAALLVASAFPDLVAGGVIGLAPSAEVLSSPVSRVAPAWTLRRRPLPPGPIRVELIRGPILVAGADDDQQLPSDLYVQQIEQRLDRKRFAYAHEEIVYEGAGHAIAVALPLLPEADPSRPGGSVEANAAARRDLWRRVLAFLER